MATFLFDLDGTLLPMDTEHFMKLYLGALAKKCGEHGLDPEKSIAAVWAGTKAMVKNDGTTANENRFWDTFAAEMGCEVESLKTVLEQFYENEFNVAKAGTRENPAAAPLVKKLKAAGHTVVLATNPLFPRCAVQTRLGWIGLGPQDFDHITSYEGSGFCKPSPGYYEEILRHIGKTPQECVMVGNDADEDGVAHTLGMQFFLVTDDLLNKSGRDISAWPNGSFAACCAHIENMMV